MGLENIQLSKRTLVDLYGHVLVELDKKNESGSPSQEHPFPYLGNNRKKISIVLNYPGPSFPGSPEDQFLQGIMGACKLSMEDISILNTIQLENSDYHNWNAHLKSKIVLLFGLTPEDIGVPLHFPHFQIQSYDKIRFLSSPSLPALENDKLLKSKLWICLKSLFSL